MLLDELAKKLLTFNLGLLRIRPRPACTFPPFRS